MKNNFRKIFSTASIILASSIPLISIADGIIPCSGKDCNFSNMMALVNTGLTWFIDASVVVAAVTFIIAGAKILMNPGNDTALSEAKKMFTKTVVGLLIVLLAWAIIHTVITALVNPETNALRFFSN